MRRLLTLVALLVLMERAQAVEFEKLGAALTASLGTKQAFQKKLGAETAYYAKGADGKATKFAFVQKRTYPPNCTHTWVVGADAKTAKITGIRVVEMSCHHAHPTKASSFLDQFKGKGPADASTLKGKVNTIAKATGSSELAADAVKVSIETAAKLKGQI